MKNKTLLITLCMLLLVIFTATFADNGQAASQKYPPVEVMVGEKSYSVYLIWVDISDPKYKVDLALAKDKIGPVEELIELSQNDDPDEEVIAAINASFFNMGADSQPASTLIMNGDIEHIAEGGSIVGFDGNNQMHSAIMDIVIEGSVNNQWEPPYNWTSWNINHLFYQPNAMMIFNKHYNGDFPEGPVYAVAVDQHQVIGKYDYIPPIPDNGYIIVQYDPKFLDIFKLGDRVDFRMRMIKRDGSGQLSDSATIFQNVENAAGAGPILIQNGQKVLDPKAEGFKLAKFNNAAAKRSMIGINQEGALAMLVSKTPITLDELADIALQLGLVEAFNLDGGGSSGLVYKGEYLVEPERKVSNAFVIKELKEQPVRLALNSKEEYFDSYPLMYAPDGAEPIAMAPLRGILEKMNATVEWDGADGRVVATRFGSNISFKSGQSDVIVDDKVYQMDAPLLIHKDKSYISIRFLTEFFGGTVEWNAEKQLADLTLPTVERSYAAAEQSFNNQDYAIALDRYQTVLSMFPDHVSALKQSAYIHDVILNDQRTALLYYQRILEIFPQDSNTYNKLGDAYYKLDVIDQAISSYQQSNLAKENYDAHIALARIYLAAGEPKQAAEHIEWSMKNAYDVKEFLAAEELQKQLP